MPDPITRFINRWTKRAVDAWQPSLDEVRALAEELGWPTLSFSTEARIGRDEGGVMKVKVDHATHHISEGHEAWDRWFRQNFHRSGPGTPRPAEEPLLLLRQIARELRRLKK